MVYCTAVRQLPQPHKTRYQHCPDSSRSHHLDPSPSRVPNVLSMKMSAREEALSQLTAALANLGLDIAGISKSNRYLKSFSMLNLFQGPPSPTPTAQPVLAQAPAITPAIIPAARANGFICTSCQAYNAIDDSVEGEDGWYMVSASLQVGVFRGWVSLHAFVISCSQHSLLSIHSTLLSRS
jgi:hypothetical protein